MLQLIITSKKDARLVKTMEYHYSQPKGFVGRSICYAIMFNDIYYGHIIAGSATKHLPGRNEFFPQVTHLNNLVNNIYFHVEKVNNQYPLRNFTTQVIKRWRERVMVDWPTKYKDAVLGFESLVEPPRTGECYLRDGWTKVGLTKGYTCKRVAGKSTDSWGGKRVWDKVNLRPKLVLVRSI